MEDNFDSVQWRDDEVDDFAHHTSVMSSVGGSNGGSGSSSTENHQQHSSGQAGPNADALDLAGVGRGVLETHVSDPQTEAEGTKDAYVSYLVTTDVNLSVCCVFFLFAGVPWNSGTLTCMSRALQTDFPTFMKPHVTVKRRFTDFVYLWTMLSREFPACAVPPLPEKHKMGAFSPSIWVGGGD